MITAEQFTKYARQWTTAHYHRVPISELDNFRAAFAKYGVFYRIRYRGPRSNVPSAQRRSPATRQSTCLKEDATCFSAYIY
jgi:hypothetical protein